MARWGVITSNTCRDTDEIITQKVPLYLKQVGRGIRPGRNEVESVNRPIVLGGVLVMPGDVVVADGDGVIVVPRAVALDVAAYAHKVIDGDKNARRGSLQEAGPARGQVHPLGGLSTHRHLTPPVCTYRW
jgi:regulator of RNase E activity RraA